MLLLEVTCALHRYADGPARAIGSDAPLPLPSACAEASAPSSSSAAAASGTRRVRFAGSLGGGGEALVAGDAPALLELLRTPGPSAASNHACAVMCHAVLYAS